jgi:hypothetical protein
MRNVNRACVALVAFVSFAAVSAEPRPAPTAEATKVYRTDEYGNVLYHKPSYAAEPDGKVMQVDPYGNRLQQQYEVKGDRVYTTDKFGNRLAPSFVVKGDKVYQTDKYGNVQHHKPSYAVQPDGEVMQVDPYGNRQQQKFEIQRDRQGPTKSANGKALPESAKK